jgi:hypothetical protein
MHSSSGIMKITTKSPLELALPPTILTALVLGLGGALSIFFPLPIVALYLAILPLPVMVLWLTRDVATPADRIAAVDAAHRS